MGLFGTATLVIEPPLEDGGSTITSYVVISVPSGIKTTIAPTQTKNATISSLIPGTEYSFVISAVNKNGESPQSSPTKPFLAPTVPGSPVITQVVATGTSTAQITFKAPLSNGGSPITSYVATAQPGGLSTNIFQSGGGVINVSNLNHSTTYTFTVMAINAAGQSNQSERSIPIKTSTPPPPPTPVIDTPAPPTIRVINQAAIAGVTAPVTGATPIATTTAGTGYTGTVTWSGSPTTFAPTTTYTAIITLTPTSGYTLSGVSANFFTISGASSVTHSANSGVITAVFPATGIGQAIGALITTQPTGAASGMVLATQPVVRIVDSAGNTVSSSTVSVVASIASGTGTLSGTTSISASSGVATFTNLVVTGTAGSYTLRFTPTLLTPVTSNNLSITVGPASKVAITRASVGTQRRTAFTTQPQITVQDFAGNTIETSTAVVTATVNANGTLIGTTTATAASGVATFTDLGLDGVIGTSYTITYTVAGLIVATSTFTLTGTTCNGSFTCQIGDTGPGGGIIFYYSQTGFVCGAIRLLSGPSCNYLESAPSGWSGTSFEPFRTWAQSSLQTTAVLVPATTSSTEVGIGWGYWNTRAIVEQGNSNPSSSAAALAFSYTSLNNTDDWFLPSKDELQQMLLNTGLLNLQTYATYWTSTEFEPTFAYSGMSINVGVTTDVANAKSALGGVRPIRAFGGTLMPPLNQG